VIVLTDDQDIELGKFALGKFKFNLSFVRWCRPLLATASLLILTWNKLSFPCIGSLCHTVTTSKVHTCKMMTSLFTFAFTKLILVWIKGNS
jgi:hypothetical protein